MKIKVGLWVDHKQAIVVTVTDKGEEMGLVILKSEAQHRRSGNRHLSGSHEPQKVTADDIRQRVITEHLNIYYDAIIAAIGDAETILIFGPGEAKGELKQRLERKKMGKLIAAVEAADKLTRPQVAAKVRAYFAH